MRINVYAEEMTAGHEWVQKEANGHTSAEQAFDAAGKRSHDYPGVQAAEKRYHDARAQYDSRS